MKIISNQFKSQTTKKYDAALDELASLKCGSSEYSAKQQEVETLLETIGGEADGTFGGWTTGGEIEDDARSFGPAIN